MRALVCLLLITAAALAADVTGKWTGSYDVVTPDGESMKGAVIMNLKQNGTELTGTMGPSEDAQWTIRNGEVNGDKITLQIQPEDHPLMKVELRLIDEHLKGEARGEVDGGTIKVRMDVTRKSD
jgi:hypothetical protein